MFFADDEGAAPDFSEVREASRWVRLLQGWQHVQLSGVALEIAQQVGDPALRFHPMLSHRPDPALWSVRVDGLEVGRLSSDGGWLDVGRDGALGARSPARDMWLGLWGPTQTLVGSGELGAVDAASAAEHIRQFIERCGVGPDGTIHHGQPDHALEARVVRGEVPVVVSGKQLAPSFVDPYISRGSQLPTLWGERGRPRYLDALLRDGNVPWAAELKIPKSGGAGSYYRHGLAQAVLYRHFIRTATPMHPWFADAGLDATSCRAVVVFPAGPAATSARVESLRILAGTFDAEVAEI